jgi:hypothetical protein
MQYEKLWEIAELADWRLMTVEYKALAVVAFVVAVVLIWNRVRAGKRMRAIEAKLENMQKEINILQMQETRRLMTEMNAKSKAEIDPRDSVVGMGGGDVAVLTMSPPTALAPPESAESAKLAGGSGPLLRRNPGGSEEV